MVNAFNNAMIISSSDSAIPGIDIIPADGTFYLFPSVQTIIEKRGYSNDIEFSNKLLQEVGIALVPGSAFGNEGCIRLSFATGMNTIKVRYGPPGTILQVNISGILLTKRQNIYKILPHSPVAQSVERMTVNH